MDKKVQAVFSEFKATMEAAPFDLPDVLDILEGFMTGGQVSVARSLTGHSRDFLRELREGDKESIGYGSILAEAYRRTFCDEVAAGKYGTAHMTQNAAEVIGLLAHTTEGLRAFTESENPEQMSLTLDADTSKAH